VKGKLKTKRMSEPEKYRYLKFIPAASLIALGVLSILILAARALLVEDRFASITGLSGNFGFAVIKHDALIVALLLICFLPAILLKSRAVGFLAKSAALLLSLFYLSDFIVFHMFNLRLFWTDIFIYGTDVKAVFFQLASMLGPAGNLLLPVIVMVFCAFILFFLLSTVNLPPKLSAGLAALAVLLVILSVAIPDISGVHAWAVKNVLEINAPNGLGRDYGQQSIQDNLYSSCGGDGVVMRTQAPQRPNIILVAIESLSTYHTRLFSEENNTVPRFDAISEKGIAFRDFFANNFNTDGGLIALLAGVPPLPTTNLGTMGKMGGFDGYFGVENTLPRRLGDMGYHTVFITSGDPAFSHKDEWLFSIGFEEIIGNDQPYYEGMKRYQFRSVPDRALYENIVYNVLPGLPESEPYFLVIENVSTHHPFQEPGTGSNREQDVFGYADAQLGWFYENMEREGFLKDTLLIITSDHRAMTPVRPDETALYGEEAPARIPLIILDQTRESGVKVDGYFQQSDLMESIMYLAGQDAAFSDFRGNLLATPSVPSRYIIYYGGNERDRVQVFAEEGSFPVRLDGDDTEFLRETPAGGSEVLDLINCIRIQASERGK